MMKLFAFASVATLVGAQECPNIPDTTVRAATNYFGK